MKVELIMSESPPNLRTLNAARYAANVFFRMLSTDISEEELAETQPDNPSDASKALDLAMLALVLLDSPESIRTVRDMVHRGESEFTQEDLSRAAWMLEGIGSGILLNAPDQIVSAANSWLGLATIEQNRCAVLQIVLDGASPAASNDTAERCIRDLGKHDKAFLALVPGMVRDTLQRIVLSGNAGGKSKVGEAKLGLNGAAAKLAVSVGAFGDAVERNSKALFEQAQRANETKAAEARTNAIDRMQKVARRNRK